LLQKKYTMTHRQVTQTLDLAQSKKNLNSNKYESKIYLPLQMSSF
jgi:hypothetical protein